MSEQAYNSISKIVEKLSKTDWDESTPYVAIEERVWYSELGRLYIEDTSDRDVEHNQSLKYLEGRFNPEVLATGEEVEVIVEQVLGD